MTVADDDFDLNPTGYTDDSSSDDSSSDDEEIPRPTKKETKEAANLMRKAAESKIVATNAKLAADAAALAAALAADEAEAAVKVAIASGDYDTMDTMISTLDWEQVHALLHHHNLINGFGLKKIKYIKSLYPSPIDLHIKSFDELEQKDIPYVPTIMMHKLKKGLVQLEIMKRGGQI